MKSKVLIKNHVFPAERLLASAGILAVISASILVKTFNPTTAGFFPVCPLHSMTGLNCPGCGLTRGFHALFNGDIVQALHFNAVLPIYALLFLYLFASMVSVAVRGRGLSTKVFKPNFLFVFLIIAVVFGIVRNLPFYPFTFLSP